MKEAKRLPRKGEIAVAVRTAHQWDGLPEWRHLLRDVTRLQFKAHGLSSSSTDFDNLDESDAVEMLRELGCIVADCLKVLWKDLERRSLIEKATSRTNWFPVVWTNLGPSAADGDEEFRKWLLTHLRPAPGQESHRKGRKANLDVRTPKGILNHEIHYFVRGVLEPGSLHRNGKDMISGRTRAKLLSNSGRRNLGNWSDAFVEKYIRLHRPDLLSVAKSKKEKWGAVSGTWAAMVEDRLGKLAKSNGDEKSPWRALKLLADHALRKHERLIQREA